jgi:hypothetical protein
MARGTLDTIAIVKPARISQVRQSERRSGRFGMMDSTADDSVVAVDDPRADYRDGANRKRRRTKLFIGPSVEPLQQSRWNLQTTPSLTALCNQGRKGFLAYGITSACFAVKASDDGWSIDHFRTAP